MSDCSYIINIHKGRRRRTKYDGGSIGGKTELLQRMVEKKSCKTKRIQPEVAEEKPRKSKRSAGTVLGETCRTDVFGIVTIGEGSAIGVCAFWEVHIVSREELMEYRRCRWKFAKHGDGRVLRHPRYRELEKRFWEDVNKLEGTQKAVFIAYYSRVKTIVQISFETDYSERSVKRLKQRALMQIS